MDFLTMSGLIWFGIGVVVGLLVALSVICSVMRDKNEGE